MCVCERERDRDRDRDRERERDRQSAPISTLSTLDECVSTKMSD